MKVRRSCVSVLLLGLVAVAACGGSQAPREASTDAASTKPAPTKPASSEPARPDGTSAADTPARAGGASASAATIASAAVSTKYTLTPEDDRLLDDLSRRSFLFFWEQTDPATGIVRDRSRTDGSQSSPNHEKVGSIASTGFGLTGLCIAAERGWVAPADARQRARTTLKTFAERVEQFHGWFYHWLNIHTGAREWNSEVSSIDTALLVAGMLTVRQCFNDDAEIVRLADTIYRRIDFPWMLNGDPAVLSHGLHPGEGFIKSRWDLYCELMIIYVLGLGSPTHPLPTASWGAWKRNEITYAGYKYVFGAPPLFVHQYSHAWIDFRPWRDAVPPQADWFKNSVDATRAHKQFALDLAKEFPGYTDNVWGITASDTRQGYKAWGGPPRTPDIDGSVVPAAAGGSLMFAPDITVPVMRTLRDRYGDRLYGRYGFADAFHPTDGWVNPDVIGIDVGITLLAAENLRTGHVWRWFMANEEIANGLRRGGLTRID